MFDLIYSPTGQITWNKARLLSNCHLPPTRMHQLEQEHILTTTYNLIERIWDSKIAIELTYMNFLDIINTKKMELYTF